MGVILQHKLECIALALILWITAGPKTTRAQEADAVQHAFVERYVGALTAQDSEGLKKLLHPAAVACINADNRDYFDFLFAKDLSYGAELHGGYKLTSFAALSAEAASTSELGGLFLNPVQPTHQFQIDTPFDARNHSLAVIRMVAKHEGAWFIVIACPTTNGIAFFRERRAEGARQVERAKQLAGEIREPLLSEIKTILAQNRLIDAVKKYRDATNVDLTTAKQVLDILAKQ